jgi:hypothetical protein
MLAYSTERLKTYNARLAAQDQEAFAGELQPSVCTTLDQTSPSSAKGQAAVAESAILKLLGFLS